MPRGMPEWVERVTVPTPGGSRSEVTFPLCNDEPSLVYFANLAAIVLHVWTSRVPTLDEPEFVLFDLDPGEKCTLQTLATVTLAIRDLLAEIGLKPLVKTTGGYGLARRRSARRGLLVRDGQGLCRNRRPSRGRRTRRARNAAAHHRQAPANSGLHRLRPGRSRQDHRRALLGARPRRRAGLDPAALGRGRGLCAPALEP